MLLSSSRFECLVLVLLLRSVYPSQDVVDGGSDLAAGASRVEKRYGNAPRHSFTSRFTDTTTQQTPPLDQEWGRSALVNPFKSKGYKSSNSYGYNKGKPGKYSPPKYYGPPNVSGYPPIHRCDLLVQTQSFSLHSPGYPQPYPPSIDCRYLIRKVRPNVCLVELEIRDFFLEPANGCSSDWLLVGERRYCGFQPPKRVAIPFGAYGEIQLIFHSGGRPGPHRGFLIVGNQLPCPPPVSRPAFPAYPPPISISKEPKAKAPIEPKPNNIVKHPPPVYTPRPPLPPPTYTPRPPLLPPTYTPRPPPPPPPPTYTPPTFPPPTTFTPPPFTTPAVPVSCDQAFQAPQGLFQSVNYPANYENNLNCELRFRPVTGYCSMEIFFTDFYVEDSRACEKDALIVGSNRYCGTTLSGQRIRIKFVGSAPVAVNFITDSYGTARGYQASFRMLACEATTTAPPYTTPPAVTCDRTFNERYGYITSVNYPLPYLRNLDCVYTIEKYSVVAEEVVITFEAFNVQDSQGCESDYLLVDGKKYCGIQTGLILRVPFRGPTVELRFHSDDSIQNTGFNVSIFQTFYQSTTAPPATTAPPITCIPQAYNEPSFLLISPQFPQLYNTNQRCIYQIFKSSKDVCAIQLKFTVFSLPGDPNSCSGDYLDGGGLRLCGDLTGQTRRVSFVDSEVVFTFISDSKNDPAEGFSIQVVQLTDCTAPAVLPPPPARNQELPCRLPLLLPAINVDSGNVPLRDGGQQCAYTIEQQEGVCGVEVTFNEFYITPSSNCQENYLEIEGRQFCGQQLNNERVLIRHNVNGSPIDLFYRVEEDKKFLWDFSATSLSCAKTRKQCSRSVLTSNGTFSYFPKTHPSGNIECDFIIQRWSKRTCRVELEFTHFYVGDQFSCASNHLTIGDQELCGNLSGRKLSFEFPAAEESLILALTHQQIVGISMNIKQIPCRRK